MLNRTLLLALCVAICEAAGLVGSLFTRPAIPGWYAQLAKPAFTPPSWVFGPVWIVLYFLMGVSLFLVLQTDINLKIIRTAVIIFLVQLFFNVMWSIVFFGMRSPELGLVDISLLWLAIVATMIAFFRISTAAGVLLIPYFLWVSFAAILNGFIWKLN